PVLVAVAGADAGDLADPDTGRAAGRERRGLGPAADVADHADGLGRGRPDGEAGAAVRRVGAEDLVEAVVRALVEEVEVELADRPRRPPAHRPAPSWTRSSRPRIGIGS